MESAEAIFITKIDLSYLFSISEFIEQLFYLFGITLLRCSNQLEISLVLFNPKIIPKRAKFRFKADRSEFPCILLVKIGG
jgi:hypothetical protein